MLPYLKATPKTKQDFENDPQQNGRSPPLQVKKDQPLTPLSERPPFPQAYFKSVSLLGKM